jgi:hypothetical protein
MRKFNSTVIATAFLVAAAGSALADCGPAVQVGALMSNPEKDTIGLLCRTGDVARTGAVTSLSRMETRQIGVRTGDAERDTFGYAQTEPAQ